MVELMVALAISGIIVAAIYSAYTLQHQTYSVQEQVVEMQQNVRAALLDMSRELRMAGYDPDGTCGAGFVTALPTQVSFTYCATDDGVDNDNDGSVDEAGELKQVTYSLYDAYNDGINDLGRQVGTAGSTRRMLAEHISQVEFDYLDASGQPTTTLSQIRSVQISILARAGQPDRKFSNTLTYSPGSVLRNPSLAATNNWGPYNDNIRRRLLITTVQCRNMGL